MISLARPLPVQVGVIPARYQSSRFPGKPLVNIAGKPMIVRTWEQAMKATKLNKVVVATDDERIAKVCRDHGADVVMTDEDIPNGTERCAQAVERLGGGFDICVNIQGDEPLIEPEIIDAVVDALQKSPDAVYRSATSRLHCSAVSVTSPPFYAPTTARPAHHSRKRK